MIALAWTVFRNSLPLQLVMLALAGWAALGANNYVQRQKGAAALTTTIEKKANDNAATATQVRESVASDKRGKPDPYARRMQ
jgi:hypothetical protein